MPKFLLQDFKSANLFQYKAVSSYRKEIEIRYSYNLYNNNQHHQILTELEIETMINKYNKAEDKLINLTYFFTIKVFK